MNIKNEIMNREEYISLRKDYMKRHKMLALFGILISLVFGVFCVSNKTIWADEGTLYQIFIYAGFGVIILFLLYLTVTPLWRVDDLFSVGTVEDIYKVPVIRAGEIIDSRYKYGVKVEGKLLLSDSLNNKEQLFNPGDEVYIFNFKEERKYCFPTKKDQGE